MAKTYNTIPTVSTGDVYTATAHNNIVTNVNNYRVPPACSLKRTAALSQTASGTYQAISWDTENFTQTDSGMWSSGTNPSRINLTTAGIYYVTGNVAFGASATGLRALRIMRNNIAAAFSTLVAGNSVINYLNVASLIQSDGTHYVELAAYQDTGGNFAYSLGDGTMLFSAVWVGQVS
jgi:hypothetical protein